MPSGSNTAGGSSKRSPPRKEEDRDATVAYRPSRGLGLPPRIQASEPRPRGGYRGRGRGGAGAGAGPSDFRVRPSGGSLPPWANRGRQHDTYIPSYMPEDLEPHLPPSRPYSRPPPSGPKWEREQSRPLVHSASPVRSRTVSSSPVKLDPAVGLDTPLKYSSGPSHQRWISPDQAGPSNYSANEAVSETVPSVLSASPNHLPRRSSSLDHVQDNVKSDRPDIAETRAERFSPRRSRSPVKTEDRKGKSPERWHRETAQDEKEDMTMHEEPHTDVPEVPEEVEQVEELDIKPDQSALDALDLPSIPDEDREEGVLAFKRELVLPCYDRNAVARSAARKAFREEKMRELSALNRSLQHVLWRDDGVGIQWKKIKIATARIKPKPAPATETTITTPTTTRVADSPNVFSPILPAQSSLSAAPQADRAALAIPDEPIITPRHELLPKPVTISVSGPSISTVPVVLAPSKTQDSSAFDSPALPKTEKGKQVAKDDNKRKADDDTSSSTPVKPPKQPKKTANAPAAGSELTKAERRALRRQQENEERASNGLPPLVKGKGKNKTAKRLAAEKEKARLFFEAKDAAAAATATNAIPLGSNGNKGKGKEVDVKAKVATAPPTGSTASTSKASVQEGAKPPKSTTATGMASVKPPAVIAPVRPTHALPTRPGPSKLNTPASASSSSPLASRSTVPPVIRPPTAPVRPVRPPMGAIRPPSSTPAAPVRPAPSSSASSSRPPISAGSSEISRPLVQHQPQYQPPSSQGSYSERQALAALARPTPAGQMPRPPTTKFAPRPNGVLPARPPTVRPPTALSGAVRPATVPSVRPPTSTNLAARPPARPTLPSRSLTPSNVSTKYDELRQALSTKMEEIDNWTSMLADLPDHAGKTERQIERTKTECFVLQKQMREEKTRMGL